MIKIDIGMPESCINCNFCQIAIDSDLFEDGEPYCCIESESTEDYIREDERPNWCPLIECQE